MPLTKVKTKYGTVVGKIGEYPENGVFLGIPFAKAERFSAPVEPDHWEKEKECTEAAPACPQVVKPGRELCMSEDCLCLNVFTPAKSAEDKLAVDFWIYGGGFNSGSPNMPDMYGEELARKGVVVVSVAYRVNILGFCSLPELEEMRGPAANYGLLDQIQAMKWVQENISAFGGDPERVLIHGQSAGGMSVRMHLTNPNTKGLFSRAIVQSGGGLNEADPIRTKEDFTNICRKALNYLGWTAEDLIHRDVYEVVNEMSRAAKETAETFEVGYFQPFIDGITITDIPGKKILRGEYHDIPIGVGTVAGDSWMFSRKVLDQLDEKMQRGFAYAASQAWARLNVREGRRPIYTYYMDRAQPEVNSRFSAARFGKETPHGSDVAYVFGTLDRKRPDFTAYDHELSDVMMTYWSNFAKNGDPNSESVPYWPLYEKDTPLAMHFGNDGYQAENLVQSEEEENVLDITERKPGILESLD